MVIAHRGASAYYPENTMAAFRGAVEMEADMIELDVMLSGDGVPVVFHDDTLDAHTDGTGLVSAHALDEMKQRDAGSWFSDEFAGERIPTLGEVLEFANGTVALNIEIKTAAVRDRSGRGVEQQCLALVDEYGMQDHVLFSSFDYRAVDRLKKRRPEMPVALLYHKGQSGDKLPAELLERYGADAFNCSCRELTKRRLRDLKAHNIPFFVYTVDRPGRMKKVMRMGAAGIFTNRPDVLKRVLDEM